MLSKKNERLSGFLFFGSNTVQWQGHYSISNMPNTVLYQWRLDYLWRIFLNFNMRDFLVTVLQFSKKRLLRPTKYKLLLWGGRDSRVEK